MSIVARAPGKVVILGEYAVLTGAPALVLAVDRYCRAEISPSRDGLCHLCSWAPDLREASFDPSAGSGMPLVDLAVGSGSTVPAWRGLLDSRALFSGSAKLGLGSSAAALTAWAGVWRAYRGLPGIERNSEGLSILIDLHRAFQGGAGSGLDVAASLFGGVLSFRLRDPSTPQVGSVRLPNSVGFAGVFAGCSASTQDYLSRYHDWRTAHPGQAAQRLGVLGHLAEIGCAAAAGDDGATFLSTLAEYGEHLERLGKEMDAEIVTREHREIRSQAKRHNVVYKVSGAGGGDLGLAFSADPEALGAFKRDMDKSKYEVVDLSRDEQGLFVEGQI